MIRDQQEYQSRALLSALTRLDLYSQSLRLMAGKLISVATGDEEPGSLEELQQRALELARECSSVLGILGDLVSDDRRDLVESTLNRVNLGIRKAAQARHNTLLMVNVWKVVEANDRLVSSLADQYGYERISSELTGVPEEKHEIAGADLAKLFAEYEDAMTREPSPVTPTTPPFEYGVLHWRGSQLYYVQRAEDGARWVELDPDVEPRLIGEENDEVEIAEARSSDGYSVKLVLDVDVDAGELDDYLRSQRGLEFYVSGFHIAAETQSRSRRNKGRLG
jgi:hypothetical protein